MLPSIEVASAGLRARPAAARSLRVALLTPVFPATSQTFVLDQITGLLDRGAEVDIFTNGGEEYTRDSEVMTRYELNRRVIYPVQPGGSRFSRHLHRIRLAARALPRGSGKAPGSRVSGAIEDAETAFWWNPPGFPRNPREYDAIHCHFGPMGKLGLALRNTGYLRGRLYTTFHGNDISAQVQRDGVETYARLFRTGDLFLPISEFWRRRLIELGAPRDKVVVHRMGVDCNRLEFTSRAHPGGGPVRLLSIARLVEKKGLEYAIRAVARTVGQGIDVEYRIVGDGPLRAELTALIERMGVSDRVTLLGAQSREGVREEMYAAHILLAPSVTAEDGDMEGIPVAIMEAMATGLLVLSTRHSGIPELVRDRHSGFLVGERDADGLARALIERVMRPAEWAPVTQAARHVVEQEFSIDGLNDRLLRLLNNGSAEPVGYPSEEAGQRLAPRTMIEG